MSHAQDARVLQVLHCRLERLLGEQVADLGVRVWREGRYAAVRSQSVATLIARLGREPLNQVVVQHAGAMPRRLPDGGTVEFIASALEVSPTNALWGPVTGYSGASRAGESARMTFDSFASVLGYHGVTKCPSFFEATAFIKSPEPLGYKVFADRFCALVDSIEFDHPVTGCMDLSRVGGALPLKVRYAVARNPLEYALLDTMFDDLHRVMLGPWEVCQQVATALGSAAAIRRVEGRKEGGPLGVVLIGDEALSSSAARERAAPWLVSC